MRSYVVVVLAVFAVTTSNCACGSGPDLICAYAKPYATGWKKVNGPLPAEGSGGPSIEPRSAQTLVYGGQSFQAKMGFSGGPIATLRFGIENACYFEIPVHPELASESVYDDIESDVAGDIGIAKTAAGMTGQFDVEFDYPSYGAGSNLRIAKLDGQLVDTSGNVSSRGDLGFMTVCTSDGLCEEVPDAGAGGTVAIASCSDGNVCSEILEGSASAYQGQCDMNGQQGSTSPCDRSKYGGGPACMGGTIMSQGQPVKANILWKPGYCAMFPNIDTKTTCTMDLKGTPTGTHCTRP